MTTEKKLTLEMEDHWDEWEQELLRKVIHNKVLGILRGTEEPLAKPTYPTIPSNMDPGPRPEARMAPRNGVLTRSQSSVTPGPDDLVLQPPSEEEKKAYQEKLEAAKSAQSIFNIYIHKYNADQKEFSEQHKGLTAVREWIMQTASEHLKTIACNPEKSLRDWFLALEKAVGADKAFSKQKLRDRYERALTTLTKTPKDFTAWITEWEHTMEKMSRKDFPEVRDSSQWFVKIQRASKDIPELQHFFTVYQMVHKQEIEDDTLSFNQMSSDLKRHLHVNQTMKRRVGKGAFPGFGPNDDEEEEKSQNKKARKTTKRKHDSGSQGLRRGAVEDGLTEDESAGETKPPQKKAKRQQPSDPERPTCKACKKNGHELSKCWDLFPELSPTPRPEWRTKKIAEQVNGDPKLKAEYDKVQAERRKQH